MRAKLQTKIQRQKLPKGTNLSQAASCAALSTLAAATKAATVPGLPVWGTSGQLSRQTKTALRPQGTKSRGHTG